MMAEKSSSRCFFARKRAIEMCDVLLSASRLLAPATVFLQEGAGSESITVDGGDLSKAAKALAFQNGGHEKAVRLRT